MLPSVSAGSAALTKYAQAAVTAPEQSARDPQLPARTDQEAGAQNDGRSAARAADETLARETRTVVTALLDLLRQRVLAALLEAGLPDALAHESASRAVSALANALADDGEHAARIVQAVLDRLDAGKAVSDRALLQIAARGLTIVVNQATGRIDITGPDIRLEAATHAARTAGAGESPHHLLDFTDGNEAKIAPVVAAFEAVRAAATGAAEPGARTDSVAVATTTALVVAPNAFTAAIARQIETHAPGFAGTATDTAAAVSRIVATALPGAPVASGEFAIRTVVDAIGTLRPAPAEHGDAGDDVGNGATIRLSSPALGIAFRPADGSVTVRIADRIVAFSPASLPVLASVPGHAATNIAISAASLPIREISPGMPAGVVLDEPTGVPFVPPEFDEFPSHREAPTNGRNPPAGHAALRQSAEDDLLRLTNSAAMQNATILRSIERSATPEATAGITRISLDLNAVVGGAPTAAAPAERIGRLGRSVPAPAQGENGAKAPQGYTDAASSKPPVLPAWHALGSLAAPAPAQPEAARPKKLPPRAYRRQLQDDAFTRDMLADYEGLVFSSVVFSV